MDLQNPKLYKDDPYWDTPEGLVAAAQRALLRLRGASEKLKLDLSEKEEADYKLGAQLHNRLMIAANLSSLRQTWRISEIQEPVHLVCK